MRYKDDKVIILKRVNFAEKDRIITVLGEKIGKISIIAKGVRSQKSKLAGAIELLSISQIQIVEGKGDISTLVGARLVQHFSYLIEDINRMQIAGEGIKNISKISHDGTGKEYFKTLLGLLESLNNREIDTRITWIWFCFHLLKGAGSGPNFSISKSENNDSNSRLNFDFDKQKFKKEKRGKFSVDDLKLLRLLASTTRPVRIKKELGSEDMLVSFTDHLLKTNLTEI